MPKKDINSQPLDVQARLCGVPLDIYRAMLTDDTFPVTGTLAAKRDWINLHRDRFSATAAAPDPYDAHKERARLRQAKQAASGRDIAPMPPVVNPARRATAMASLRTFLETYFAKTFYLAWSPDHLDVIESMEHAIRHGGRYAIAMPRGSGKTALCQGALLYAAFTGLHKFAALVQADQEAADEALEAVKMELSANDLLVQDFPEVCYPIAKLENLANRANGQTLHGRQTRIIWRADRVRLPTVHGSAASGVVIATAGITGGVRGLNVTLPGQGKIRPTFILIDDPQTDASARSPTQTEARLETIQGSILGLVGPGESLTVFMPCTIIRPGDVSDQALGGRFPDWQAKRTRMVITWPEKAAEPLWERYLELRREDILAKRTGDASHSRAHYIAHRDDMDRGAVVAWEARRESDELSALQHAYNLKFRVGDVAFAAEYQNDPNPVAAAVGTLRILPEHVPLNRVAPGHLPTGADRLAIHIDVHDKILYWCAACGDGHYRAIAFPDFGTYPEQGRGTWTMGSVKRTIRRAHQGLEPEAAIQAALVHLIRELANRDWPVAATGASRRADRILVDLAYLPDVVLAAIKETGLSHVQGSRGLGIGAAHKPFDEYKNNRGDLTGDHWRIETPERRKASIVKVDANYWKSALARRLHLPPDDPAHPAVPGGHVHFHSFVAHLGGKYGHPVPNAQYGRTVHEWKVQPGAGEDHWFDNAYNAFAALSILGAVLTPATEPVAKKRKAPRYSGIVM